MALDTEAIKLKVADLQAAIEAKQPGYIGILKVIHENMKLQPELTYKLEDEEIATLIRGLEMFHRTEITEPKMKKPISKKTGNLLSADDV